MATQTARSGNGFLLVANPPLFSCLAEQALGEIETLLCLGQLLLEVLNTMFNGLEALRDVGRG
ncbi:MAG: hypothetical protein AUG74_22850 [Bacteroidetes bacterium 13_1_20CM_4_60_6]|nr:MAG: hypothetical protein AUG74_22850 [Bacteroidetes bacterium 13_1_20CM_4_60_6]